MLAKLGRQAEDPAKAREFGALADRVEAFVSLYSGSARGLAMICAEAGRFFWHHELNVPLRNGAHCQQSVYIEPLVALFDEYERYGVILADRARARLFSVFLGEIEEDRGALSSQTARHTKASGTDHIWSERRFQRRANQHVHQHLKEAAAMISRWSRDHAFDRLVLADTRETVAELRELLPSQLRSRVIGSLNLTADVSETRVLESTLDLAARFERESEARLVDELVTKARKTERTAIGIVAVADAVSLARAWKLIYVEGFRSTGSQCSSCHALFSSGPRSCRYCGAPVSALDDLLEALVNRVIDGDGHVEVVRGPASEAPERG